MPGFSGGDTARQEPTAQERSAIQRSVCSRAGRSQPGAVTAQLFLWFTHGRK